MSAPISARPFCWLVIAMTMGVLSVYSYVWLFYTLRRRLAPGVRKRLFPRQLQSLAVAGFIFNVFLLPILYIDLWNFGALTSEATQGKYDDLCTYAYGIFRTARSLCILQEMHLALTFLAQAMRWAWALPALNRGIPVVWLGGFTLGVLDFQLSKWTFDLEQNTCVDHKEDENDNPDLVSVVTITFCAAVSLISFLCTLRRSASSSVPNSVRQKNYKRAAAYPAVTVISYSCVVGAYLNSDLFEHPRWYWPIASILQASNGVLNTFTFYSQSRYASMLRRGTQSRQRRPDHGPVEPIASQFNGREQPRDNAADFGSWHVDFGGVDMIEIITSRGSYSSSESGRNWRDILHFLGKYDERVEDDDDGAWTVQDLINISLQERTLDEALGGAGSEIRGAPGPSGQPEHLDHPGGKFQLCPDAPDGQALDGEGGRVSQLNTEERSITEDYFERLSDEDAVGTAREFDLSTAGGRRRATRRGQTEAPERQALRSEAEDLRDELASRQAQTDRLSEVELTETPVGSRAGSIAGSDTRGSSGEVHFRGAPLVPEHMPSCLSLPTPEQIEYCE